MTSRQRLTADDALLKQIACDCVLTRGRLIARVLTNLYDEALRPLEIGSPQFSLLVVVSKLAPASRADIGRFNHLDRSTLTRNLQLLLAGGWIRETQPVAGSRGRPIVLTAAGRQLLLDAAPAWKAAQAKAEEVLGRNGFKTLMNVGDGMMNPPHPA